VIIVLTREAEHDLEQIGDYIALDNPHRALSFVRELRERCVGLAKLPFAFPLILRYEHLGVRHRVDGNDQIFYRVVETERRIDMLHVIHSTRHFAAILFP
jgi:plasmid stabilization system protein ParE